MPRAASFLLLLIILLYPLQALPQALNNRIQGMISEGVAARPIWGIYAIDLSSGDVLADINGSRLFVPASNRKLVSTAMVVMVGSPEDRLATELVGSSLAGIGRLSGDLVVRASGDPSWMAELMGGASGTTKLRDMAREASRAGLKQVEGDLVVDLGRFTEPDFLGHGWTWNNLVFSYASRPAAFSINGNVAAISLRPAGAGNPVDWSFPLGGDPFEIRNEGLTGRAGSVPTLTVDLLAGGDVLLLRGNLPADSSPAVRSVPVGQPVVYTARLLRAALEREGIEIRGDIRTGRNINVPNSQTFARVEGATLAEMIRVCNRDSDNFLAESLYLLASARRLGAANYEGARQVEGTLWNRLGVASGEVDGVDGSGLSRENFITPRALVALLEAYSDTGWFVDSLPVSGRSGTLRHRLSEDGMAGRVQAKTGTINGVSGLSGYVRTNSGRTVVFSIMANHYTTSHASIRRKIDEIVTELARR